MHRTAGKREADDRCRPDSGIEDPETERQLWKYSRPTVSLVSDRIPSCLYGFGGLTRLVCPTNSPNAALIPLRCGERLPAAKRLSRRGARADGTGHTWLRLRHVNLELAACPSPKQDPLVSQAKALQRGASSQQEDFDLNAL